MHITIIPLVNPNTIKVPLGDKAGSIHVIIYIIVVITILGFSFYEKYQKEKE